MFFQRLMTTDDVLTAVPFGAGAAGVWAQASFPGVTAGPWAVLAAFIGFLGLYVKGRFQDRREQRDHEIRNERYQLKESRDETFQVQQKLIQANQEILRLREHNEGIVRRNPEPLQVIDPVSSCSIVLLEDFEPAGKQVARYLRKAGHHVRRVQSVADAIYQIELDPPQVLIFDLNVAGVDGEVAFDRARALSPSMTAICVSGTPDEERLDRLRRANVLVFQKPVDDRALLAAINPAQSGGMPIVKLDESKTL